MSIYLTMPLVKRFGTQLSVRTAHCNYYLIDESSDEAIARTSSRKEVDLDKWVNTKLEDRIATARRHLQEAIDATENCRNRIDYLLYLHRKSGVRT